MLSVRRIIPSLVSISVKNSSSLCVHSPQSVVAKFIHGCTEANIDTVVNSICGSFRKGCNWDILTQNFDSVRLNDLIVEKVLLELKEPTDAKRALAFFHWSAQRKKFEHGNWSYCITIHILVQARLLTDARALLESVLKKNAGSHLRFSVVDSLLSSYKITVSTPFVFDLLVQAYAKLRMFEIAFDVCRYLEEHGFSSSLISFNTLIHVVQKSYQVPLVWKIYEHLIQNRTYPNEVTIRTMISALCKEGHLQKYVDILDRIHGVHCKEGRIAEAHCLMKEMEDLGLKPYSECFDLLIEGCAKAGKLEESLMNCEKMLERRLVPSCWAFNDMVGKLSENGNVEQANAMLTILLDKGFLPDEITYSHLIEGYGKKGEFHEVVKLYYEIENRSLSPGLLVYMSMIRSLCLSGKVEEAEKYLRIMKERSLAPTACIYETLIASHSKKGDRTRALHLQHEMFSLGLKPSCS
ncbi:hypothetical protein RGQ29_011427 [Quercus rubra]|uniref:Pentatricopeptide repeat-containing protein n=1 Tax=Quercus rubra TaxID=3512 RepID=A0AAN7FY05_QUERU|nr:hypothetical protein RGQ29_011427 [Quercus rubra]KAK4602373.1 hypothetical protein RGQ29_011427 [Quercus rubra]